MTIGIFTGGEITKGGAITDAIKKLDMVIAADSGAKHALDYHCFPKFVIGDFDSLDKKTTKILEEKGCQFISYASEKDQTDTELAITFAIKQKATKIFLFGAIKGDRIDHILGNIFLPIRYSVPISFVDKETSATVLKGPQTIKLTGKKNDLLSLIPLVQSVTNITTKNLYYPLHNDTLSLGTTRGMSNCFTKNTVELQFEKGRLLVIHTRTT